ncbi:FAD-dependent oxidoreductase [Niastella caeni]|uniref:FAD-dependent oxidoreductase n=1 Tax=Niastella caeni TaxID=2569763 RepID=A0A4S8HYT7_9BACT|nr:FAD-dependent oxidoreductase [Niastella caeni]THU40907.1 FAD-dependent oxidoreductase [Niastella caeni]
MHRRRFIQSLSTLAGTGLLLPGCAVRSAKQIPGEIVGAAAAVGHLLRDGVLNDTPEHAGSTDVVIAGGGISGLSAARWLRKKGINNFVLFDLEKQVGGNAASGQNKICHYPWGAHYIPVPNNDLTEYLSFLQECNVITGYNAAGLPEYNEYHLCFAPEERLYINGVWQAGLVPHIGVPNEEQEQIKRFLEQMETFRYAKGTDGKDAFAIPVNNSSKDTQYVQLDQITMKAWLLQNGYTSNYLHWYCNYCTRDDFGTRYDEASAWAGIHYFAGRKGKAANAEHQDVITWPQGNAWLAQQLQKGYSENVKVNSLVTGVEETSTGVDVVYLDVPAKRLKKITARKCIIAAPQFVAQRLIKNNERQSMLHRHFSYSPWMVANITVKELAERQGEGLCWDNVLYDSESLGYVEATHQLLQQHVPDKVLTYYLPLTKSNAAAERKHALSLKHTDWTQLILHDLQRAHSNIQDAVQHIDVMLWGHAMIQPTVNFVHSTVRNDIGQPINNKVFFAHTDLAGISIFEEGFYQGIQAADAVIKSL